MNTESSDVCEYSDEAVFTGRIRVSSINSPRVVLIGSFSVKGLVVTNELVIIGNGYVNLATCYNGLVISYGKPIYINRIYCNKLYVIGSKHPVLINYGKIGELYVTHSIVKELYSRKLYAVRRVNIVELNECRELFFKEPYNWIEFLNCNTDKVVLNY